MLQSILLKLQTNCRRQSSSNNGGGGGIGRRYNSTERDRDSDESDDNISGHFYNKTPSNTIIVLGLQSHITEADVSLKVIVYLRFLRGKISIKRLYTNTF